MAYKHNHVVLTHSPVTDLSAYNITAIEILIGEDIYPYSHTRIAIRIAPHPEWTYSRQQRLPGMTMPSSEREGMGP